MQLKVSIDAVLFLSFQWCALKSNDESKDSLNCGNFVELIKLLASYNLSTVEFMPEKAPNNASYTSSNVQKEILQVLGGES